MIASIKSRLKRWLHRMGYWMIDRTSALPWRSPQAAIPALTSKTVTSREVQPTSISVAPDLHNTYDNHYQDEKTQAWYDVCGRTKADNIRQICDQVQLRPLSVLEVGAGSGAILAPLAAAGIGNQHYAAEISPSGLAAIAARQIPTLVESVLFDGYQLPYGDQSFDLVVLSYVLEHVEYPRMLLREIQRVSQFQVIEIPIDYSPSVDQHTDYFLAYGHLDIYTPSLLRFLLQSEKFTVHDHLLSTISLDVLMHIEFVTENKSRTPQREQVVRERYARTRQRFDTATPAARERIATAYTVFTSRQPAVESVHE